MGKILYDKYPLIINAALACKIGLNESIILQQVHYWIEKKMENNSDFHDGHYWVYNTYEEWQKQFPFWSNSTVRRAISKLEKSGLLISGNYNRLGLDKTKWYSINYELLNCDEAPSVQNEQMDCSKCTVLSVQNEQSNTIDYTDNSTKTTRLKVLNGATSECSTRFDPQILKRQIIKSCKNSDINSPNEYIEIIQYYYKLYMDTFREEHPRISEAAMDSVVHRLSLGTDIIDNLDFDIYKSLIDKHFETQYNNCDYNICHFMTDGIRDNRFYETCY